MKPPVVNPRSALDVVREMCPSGVVLYQEGPYSPCYFYRVEDMEEGDPSDSKWRGYLRTSYAQPKEGALCYFQALQRETGEVLYDLLQNAGLLGNLSDLKGGTPCTGSSG